MPEVPLYDEFGEDYDRFVDWPARLEFELPFFRAQFVGHDVKRVLDVACGTGHHAIAFAQEGYEVTGADLSGEMIRRARANASEAGVDVDFHQLGFGELAGALDGPYDAITCLGNSLPHLTTPEALRRGLRDMATLLRTDGLLIIQNRNFDRVLARRNRFMSPQTHEASDGEWLFYRFYDWQEPTLRFNVVRMRRQGKEPWQVMGLGHTTLYPWTREELVEMMLQASLQVDSTFGSYRGEPFDPMESGDLVLVGLHELPRV